jgi:hypothetical protein
VCDLRRVDAGKPVGGPSAVRGVAGERTRADPVNPERLTQRAGRIQGASTGEVYRGRAGLECEVG